MSFSLVLPQEAGPPHRGPRLAAAFDLVERGIKSLMMRPFKFGSGAATSKLASAALNDLGVGGVTATLYDHHNNVACLVAIDYTFAVTTAGTLMMMPRSAIQERIKEQSLDGLLAETVREVMNVATGRMAEGLRKTLEDPEASFPREEYDVRTNLPRTALIVVSANCVLDGNPAGRLQGWFPLPFLSRIK